ncbi:hypothetical protein LIER_24126 [Lithospermum erythrorhizon]|uniref:Uncharacterized protein n=1 Tax=Lithospermum erythrorhizon TaxID=34254 RepID=A0AAV3R274_LITER
MCDICLFFVIRHLADDGWATSAAAKALQKLQEIVIRETHQIACNSQENVLDADQEYFSDSSANTNTASTVSSKDSLESCHVADQEASEFVRNTIGTEIFEGVDPPEGNVDIKSKST